MTSACPSTRELDSFCAGTALTAVRDSVQQHARACPACAQRLADGLDDEALLPAVRRVLGTAPAAPAAPELERYRIVRCIGEGGMGMVYEAVQQKPERTVALKVLRPGTLSPSSLRRFELEAEVLGRLDHPGIARIFEAGTYDSGAGPQPFFAMQLVAGRPLSELTRTLDTPACVRLVIELCDAVQHAHQRGVIHRDLKPSNILVTDAGRPVILDFGIARVTDGDSAANTLRTQVGGLVGTLPYMSPEQVRGDPDEIDTRTDVHALGVVLFEQLTGELPRQVTDTSVADTVRLLADAEPRRLGTLDKRLRGDLETIAGKALERDKTRRYASAATFADDLRRFLDDEPITARPPSALYVAGKFARRHRTLVAAVATVTTVLVAAVILSLQLMRQAQRGRERAEREAAKSGAVTRLLQDVLWQANPYRSGRREPTIREALDAVALRLDRRQLEDPEVEAAVRYTLGMAYAALALAAQAEPHLQRARQLSESRPDPDTLADVLAGLATLARRRGDANTAEPLVRRALELTRAAPSPRLGEIARHLHHLGTIVLVQGRLAEAEPLLRDAAAHAERAADLNTLINAKRTLAHLYRARGELDAALPLLQQALALQRTSLDADNPNLAQTLDALVSLRAARSEFTEAEEHARESLAIRSASFGEDHAEFANSLMSLADVLLQTGDAVAAEEPYRRALAIVRAAFGDDDARTMKCAEHLSYALVGQDKYEEAEALRRSVADGRAAQLGPTHPDAVLSLRKLAEVLVATGRAPEAAHLLDERLTAVLPAWTGADHARFLQDLQRAYGDALARFDPTKAAAEAAAGRAILR